MLLRRKSRDDRGGRRVVSQKIKAAIFKNDIALRNGEDSYELPVPATYVLDTSGVIRFAHVDVDYMIGRAESEEIISALKTIVHPVGQ